MNRRMFDIAVLNAELKAKFAIMEFEKKFAPPQEKGKPEDAKEKQPAPNNAPEAQY